MKKKILISILFAFVLSTKGQTLTENYVHTTTLLSATEYLETDAEVVNYEKTFSSTEIINFTGSYGGSGSAIVTINGNQLTFYISASWSTNTNLKLGSVGSLNTLLPIPDMDIGELKTSTGSLVGRFAEIKNGQLYFDIHTYVANTPGNCSITITKTINYNIKTKKSVTYFDGLGRAKQHIEIAGGGLQEDLITHFEYDNIGRVNKEFLPYPSGSGNLNIRIGDIKHDTKSYYQSKYPDDFTGLSTIDINAYSENIYESSPLNRVLEKAAPGKDWKKQNNHTIRFEYDTNTIEDYVRIFSVNTTLSNGVFVPTLVDNTTNYPAGELYKTITKDENWASWHGKDKTTEEYKNKQGQVILKRSFNNEQWHDIYYVYDDFGNLTYVLPPKITSSSYISQQEWTGNFYELDSSNLFTDSMDEVEFYIYFSPNGFLSLNIQVYGAGEIEFDDSSIDLNGILKGLDLPYMYFGELIDNETGNDFAEAEIFNNRLYFWSTSTSSNEGYAEFSISIDLNNYQNSFTPPVIDQTQLDKLAYQYKYDGKNRLAEKKIPGKDWEYIIYDNLDRPVLTQDGIQRIEKKWNFIKYDKLSRKIYSGIYTHSSIFSQQEMQNYFNTSSTQYGGKLLYELKNSQEFQGNLVLHHYTNYQFPFNNIEILNINYYDNYDFNLAGTFSSMNCYGVTSTNILQNLSTGIKTKVLDESAWITTVNYYDKKARLIYEYKKNEFLSTIDQKKLKLDFTGNVIESENTHKKTGKQDIIITDKFTYDQINRLLTHKQKINYQPEELIVKNIYDELGQLITKNVGNTENYILQEVNYDYNVRGWLKKINDPFTGLGEDLFAMKISYNDDGTRLYNGNISKIEWKTASDNSNRYYNYYYDDLSRLLSASYYSWGQGSRFNLSSILYDKNGNLKRLYRTGAIVENPDIWNSSHYGTMDYLTYNYDGNQLINVVDNGNKNYGFKDGIQSVSIDDYDYDVNGNLIKDENKNISSITYNHLNLPKFVNTSTGTIEYTYDANGIKLQKKVSETSMPDVVTKYVSGFVYKEDELQFFGNSEGYASPKNFQNYNTGFDYIYQYKDHLGNVRLSYKKNPNTTQQIIFEDSFESISNWDNSSNSFGWGITTIDNSKKITGTFSGRIDDNYPTDWEKYVYSDTWTPINNTEDTYYTVSGWIFLENVPGNDAQIWLSSRRAGETGYPSGNYGELITIQGSWQYISKTVLITADVRELNIRIDNNKDGSVWFDDVKITKGNADKTLVIEESNYYPFGLKHQGYNNVIRNDIGNPTAQKYKFGGKELQDELGLDWYDISARNYDLALGRWFVIDALADVPEQIDKSPYQYAWNNPVYYADPDGNCPICLVFVVGAFLLSSEPAMAPTNNQQSNYKGYQNAKDGQTAMLMLAVSGAGAGSIKGLFAEVGMDVTGIINPKDVVDITKTVGKNADNLVQGGKKLLDGELKVGTYDDLTKAGTKGDDITAHHMPSADFMKSKGIDKGDGVTMNMEHPNPGKGGRHRETSSYGRKSDKTISARTSLARDIKDVRAIYLKDNLYTPQTRDAFQNVIKLNKELYPKIFNK